MLENGQNFTLNYTAHRFFAYNTRNYRHRASFAYFYLTSISQHDYHASVYINVQMVLFDQL